MSFKWTIKQDSLIWVSLINLKMHLTKLLMLSTLESILTETLDTSLAMGQAMEKRVLEKIIEDQLLSRSQKLKQFKNSLLKTKIQLSLCTTSTALEIYSSCHITVSFLTLCTNKTLKLNKFFQK